MSEQENHDWLEKFITDKKEQLEKTGNEKYDAELERIKTAAASQGIKIGNLDKDKYFEMCDKLSNVPFTCDVPEGWEEEYAKHMQAKYARFGSGCADAHIKPIGKKRLF